MNLAESLHLIGMDAGPSARQSRMLDRLPSSWRMPVWRKVQSLEAQHRWYPEWKDREGNVYLYALLDRLDARPVKVDDDASDIRRKARVFAAAAEQITKRHTDANACRTDLEALCKRWGIDPPYTSIATKPAIARMLDERWSRRKFKRQHERSLEADAIALGVVHRKASLYISDEAIKRYRATQRMNAEMLEQTTAVNEEGDEFTLAELAACGISNKKNRRAELMTRLRGFEDIAKQAGHVAEFITLTAPSPMHARLWASGETNPAHDGTTPRQVHAYLQNLWILIRAKLDRRGVRVYGIRIAEPHHDGCPHWHLLLFVDPAHVVALRSIVKEYAMRERPDEPGAAKRRVTFESIDPAKGSAVGYVAKYIGKNIDGTGLDADDEGLPAKDSAERVNAWASLHGIRQFQFVGGPPVGLWRELRRVPAETISAAPDMVRRAWDAAQRRKRGPVTHSTDAAADLLGEGEHNDERRADYGEFLRVIGGPQQRRRNYPLQVAKRWTDRESQYGEEAGWKPFGVMLADEPAAVYASIRHTWTRTGRRGSSTTARPGRAPWTRVNNCTGDGPPASRQDRPKRASEPEKAPQRRDWPSLPAPGGPFAALLSRFGPAPPPAACIA